MLATKNLYKKTAKLKGIKQWTGYVYQGCM